MKITLFFAALIGFCSLAPAAEKKSSPKPWINYDQYFVEASKDKPTQYKVKDLSPSAAKKSARSLAAVNESSLSAEFKDYSSRLMALKSTDDEAFARIISELISASKAGSLKSNDTKLFAALLMPMSTFRGFLWNMSRLNFSQVQKSIYASAMRSLYGNALHSNNSMSILAFNYLYLPYEGMEVFNSAEKMIGQRDSKKKLMIPPTIQLQKMMYTKTYAALQDSLAIIQGLDLSTEIPIDLKLLAPKLPDGFPRYSTFGPKEQIMTMSAIELMMGRICMLEAFDITNLPFLIDRMIANTIQFIGKPTGLMPSEIAAIAKQSNIFALTPKTEVWLEKAWAHYQNSAKYGEKGFPVYFEMLKPILQAVGQLMQINLEKDVETNFNSLMATMKAGSGKITNFMTGKQLEVNLARLFSKDTPRPYSFFPTAYKSGDSYLTRSVNNAEEFVFNPSVGLPSEWSISEFKKYFPNAEVSDLPMIKNILLGLGFPYAMFIN